VSHFPHAFEKPCRQRGTMLTKQRKCTFLDFTGRLVQTRVAMTENTCSIVQQQSGKYSQLTWLGPCTTRGIEGFILYFYVIYLNFLGSRMKPSASARFSLLTQRDAMTELMKLPNAETISTVKSPMV